MGLYEGGWEGVRAEHLQQLWKEKYDEWLKRPKTKLPKWFGERQAKKPVTQTPPTMRRRPQLKHQLRMKRKKKRRKKSKCYFKILQTSQSDNRLFANDRIIERNLPNCLVI